MNQETRLLVQSPSEYLIFIYIKFADLVNMDYWLKKKIQWQWSKCLSDLPE